MKEKDCIFCKIAAGEIPSATLYEDDDFRVILDLGTGIKRSCIDSSERTLPQFI